VTDFDASSLRIYALEGGEASGATMTLVNDRKN
jgi:hypothetical protein